MNAATSQTPWADRRSALKGQILHDLSVTVGEAWDMWYEAAEDRNLSDDTLFAVLSEIGDELARRAERLSR